MRLSCRASNTWTMKTDVVDPIEIALREDIGDGDLTTKFFVDKKQLAMATIVAHERAILAGIETAAEVFRRVDANIQTTSARKDGEEINAGENALALRGPAHSILTAE